MDMPQTASLCLMALNDAIEQLSPEQCEAYIADLLREMTLHIDPLNWQDLPISAEEIGYLQRIQQLLHEPKWNANALHHALNELNVAINHNEYESDFDNNMIAWLSILDNWLCVQEIDDPLPEGVALWDIEPSRAVRRENPNVSDYPCWARDAVESYWTFMENETFNQCEQYDDEQVANYPTMVQAWRVLCDALLK